MLPYERCDTVEELRARESPDRLLMLAREGDTVVGSGVADRGESADSGAAAPRVLPDHRRRGIGEELLRVLADHCTSLGLPRLRAKVDDEGSLAFAGKFGFVEVGREVELTRRVADAPPPPALPEGLEVVTSAERPGLWETAYDGFGREALAGFAVATAWRGDRMFLALHGGEVIGCAGLLLDTDEPTRAENALTAVRRDWRGRDIAVHLKLRTLEWAASQGIDEVYTWTQSGNAAERGLNERLGYVTNRTSTTVARGSRCPDRPRHPQMPPAGV